MSEKRTDAEDKLIAEHCTALGEHFDTVHIFVTRHEPGEFDGTLHLQQGSGNWFARYGQIREWVITQEEIARNRTRQIKSEE